MPEEPNHNHPSYEETFRRIATILDVVAEEQHEQALRGAAVDGRIRELVASQKELAASQKELAASQKATDARIRQLAEATDANIRELREEHKLTERALREYVEEGRIRDAETTDKLNALIELMDRRLREQAQH